MRVALLTLYPRDTRLIPGGVRMVAYNLVKGLEAYPDLDLHVIHCHSDIERDCTTRDGRATLHYLAMPRRRIIPNLLTSIGRVVRELRVVNPDLVHAHAAHYAFAATRAGYPTIYTIHGVLSRERKIYTNTLFDRLRYGLLSFYQWRALRRVDKLVAISPYVMKEYGHIRSASWVRIDNPVPQDYFDLEDHSEPGRVLYAGSIDERKDLLTLLRAVVRVRRVFPGLTLRIAGRVTSVDYDRRVKAFVEAHNLQGVVRFLGLLEREALKEEYGHCAVLALSSLQESAPMVVIEAMAAGKPVIATGVGGVPDLVAEGETGYIMSAGDDAAMARRLAQLLSDPELSKRMGKRAREVARDRFGASRVARSYYDLYHRVWEEREGGHGVTR